MARTLPSTFVTAANAQETDLLLLALVTITHSKITTMRLVNNTQDVTSNGNTFTAYPFEVTIPADVEGQPPKLDVRAFNAGLEVVTPARTVAGDRERAKVTLQIASYADPDTIYEEWTDYDAVQAAYDLNMIAVSASIESWLTEEYPGPSMTPADFPGMF